MRPLASSPFGGKLLGVDTTRCAAAASMDTYMPSEEEFTIPERMVDPASDATRVNYRVR
jgi:hypothetical protein